MAKAATLLVLANIQPEIMPDVALADPLLADIPVADGSFGSGSDYRGYAAGGRVKILDTIAGLPILFKFTYVYGEYALILKDTPRCLSCF